jgi:hypothetical protein
MFLVILITRLAFQSSPASMDGCNCTIDFARLDGENEAACANVGRVASV